MAVKAVSGAGKGRKRHYCPKGHEIIRAVVVPVKGRRRLEWVCATEQGTIVECGTK